MTSLLNKEEELTLKLDFHNKHMIAQVKKYCDLHKRSGDPSFELILSFVVTQYRNFIITRETYLVCFEKIFEHWPRNVPNKMILARMIGSLDIDQDFQWSLESLEEYLIDVSIVIDYCQRLPYYDFKIFLCEIIQLHKLDVSVVEIGQVVKASE